MNQETHFIIRLFNDLYKQETSFICNGKEWGVGRSKGERERERVRCGVWVKSVAAWAINLTIGQVFVRVYRWDNPEVYQDDHKTYTENLWTVSLGALTFHPSDKPTIYHNRTSETLLKVTLFQRTVLPTFCLWFLFKVFCIRWVKFLLYNIILKLTK